MVEEYKEQRYVAASDILRQVVIYDEGGIYLDLDGFILEWDNDWLHYFDSIYLKDTYLYKGYCVNNYQMITIPKHPINLKKIQLFKESFLAKEEDKPLHLRRCLKDTHISTLFETGPYLLTVAYVQEYNKDNRNDIVINPGN